MRGLIIDIARKQEWGSRNVRRSMREIEAAVAELTLKNGKTPDSRTVADHLGIPYDKYQEIIGKNSLLSIASLDTILEKRRKRNGPPRFRQPRRSSSPRNRICAKNFPKSWKTGIDSLKEKEKIIISLYYVEELNMREIAQVLDVSEPRVSQLHSGAIKKLREYIEREFQMTPGSKKG